MWVILDLVFNLLFLIVVSRAIDLALRCFEGLGFRESVFTKGLVSVGFIFF